MKITSFGEVLWDNFPNYKVLDGAPLNVLVRLSALGADCSLISRHGNDQDGEALLKQVQNTIATDLIQVDNQYPTSLVNVQLDKHGNASYDVVYPCAWDNIAATEAAKTRIAQSDAFIYGSLGVRDERSRQALNELLPHAKFKIFDANLRKPHYDVIHLREMMNQADFIRLNDDELYEIAAALGSPYHGLEQHIHYLAEHTQTQHFCITLGGYGALYYRNGEIFAHHGYRVNVIDTVGAGDNFLFSRLYLPIPATQRTQRNACLCLCIRRDCRFTARRNPKNFHERYFDVYESAIMVFRLRFNFQAA
ncbi:PfkB family carbohydrate kinase [Kingella negevensis]|nr:PfkB family carbohydrate kinase [Kingella negevensis]MDK4696921.1 PfkB family carbohydrate kinase [Kingella negevensis]